MNDDVDPRELERIEAFRNIHPESLKEICGLSGKKSLKKGEILFLEKDKIRHFYGVLSGKVSLYRLTPEGQKRVFFILGEGSLLNEVVFDDLPVSVVCEAFEPAILLRLGKEEFLTVMRGDFDLTMNILNSIGRKQRRLYRQLKNTLPIGLDKKLAAKLWKLAKDFRKGTESPSEGEWQKIDMNISCTYLSYMLGTTRESISRAMKALQGINAVKWEKHQLYVKQERLLQYYRNSGV